MNKILNDLKEMMDDGASKEHGLPPIHITVENGGIVLIGGTLTTEVASGKPADKKKRSTEGHSD